MQTNLYTSGTQTILKRVYPRNKTIDQAALLSTGSCGLSSSFALLPIAIRTYTFCPLFSKSYNVV
ncbi:MAG: hypothetical protein ABUT20_17815 [Bacteroidota bacterium]